MVEITEEVGPPSAVVNSDGWIEVKGSDVLLKVIDFKAPLSLNKNDTTTSTANGSSTPEAGPTVKIDDTVLMNMTVRIANDINDTTGPVVQEAKSWVVTVGDLDVLPKCMEWSLLHLRAGDIAQIYSTAQYSYGMDAVRKYKPNNKAKLNSNPDNNNNTNATTTTTNSKDNTTSTTSNSELCTMPINSSVMYHVEILQIVADTSRLNPYFPIQKATTRKNIANDIYQYEWETGGSTRERVIRLYEKVVKDMKKLINGTYFSNVEQDHPQKKQVRTLLIDCLNNVTAVYITAKRYNKGKESALIVLERQHDPNNVKAVVRLVKCCVYDPTPCPHEEVMEAFRKADSILTYKHPNEEEEIKKLKSIYQRKKEK